MERIEFWEIKKTRLDSEWPNAYGDQKREILFKTVCQDITGDQFNLMLDKVFAQAKGPPTISFFQDLKRLMFGGYKFTHSPKEQIEPEVVDCQKCMDTGVCFVVSNRESPKTLAMKCTCLAFCLWDLPTFTSDFKIVKWPYLQIMNRKEWFKWSQLYKKHIHKSKLIWEGEE